MVSFPNYSFLGDVEENYLLDDFVQEMLIKMTF